MSRLRSTIQEMVSGKGGDFILVQLTPGSTDVTPVYDHKGELLRFSSGGEAAKAASSYAEDHGCKVQPRRIIDADWRAREAKRVKDGSYVALPWVGEKWWAELEAVHKDHFPHISLKKSAMIAYTKSADEGSADVQTIIKPGRYLERFFSERLNQYVIRDLCCIISAKHEDNRLIYADTEEEIEEVYLTGPNSCMSKDSNQFKTGGVHPVRMYAAGDLQVAYIRRGGRIVARSLVFPAKKVYNTIYGDTGRLEPLLRKEGYKKEAPMGARLIKKPIKCADNKALKTFICPHVDNVGWVQDKGEFLIVGDPNGGTIDSVCGIVAGGGGGLTEPVGFDCAACSKDSLPQRHVVPVYIDARRSEHRCKGCAAKTAVVCGITNYQIDKKIALEIEGLPVKHIWDKYEKDTFVCEGSGKRWSNDRRATLPDGQVWSLDHWRRHGTTCSSCGTMVAKDNCDGSKCKMHKKAKAAQTISAYR